MCTLPSNSSGVTKRARSQAPPPSEWDEQPEQRRRLDHYPERLKYGPWQLPQRCECLREGVRVKVCVPVLRGNGVPGIGVTGGRPVDVRISADHPGPLVKHDLHRREEDTSRNERHPKGLPGGSQTLLAQESCRDAAGVRATSRVF